MAQSRTHDSANDAAALATWEDEGGSVPAARSRRDPFLAHLTNRQQRIVNRLGAAVLTQWAVLPTHIQKLIFDTSVSAANTTDVKAMRRRIAQLLHARGN